ncbi:transglycosylase [Azoarcus sp. DD4]|uniref:murein transglycosylase A n=1 Tax=Azoarcus sp. DD4 TaxID=2027405 RepID=UPI001128F905|nr:murein transglycosylase A [Azoarcus sp. DD4]QDF95862.1 transglycosylase [Azoarcus sp. DD4]
MKRCPRQSPLLPSIVATLTVTLSLLSACTTSTSETTRMEPPLTCPAPKICAACSACPSSPKPSPSPDEAAQAFQPSDWGAVHGWLEDDPSAVWPAFRSSCRTMEKQAQWQKVCSLVNQMSETPSPATARAFFEQHFTPWALANPDGSRTGLITGYYEPLIKGSRTPNERYRWAVHATPKDMLTIDLSAVYPDLKNYRLRGRLVGNRVLPYWNREELDKLENRLPAETLLWAADPIDLFFLQVQGSGQVELPDGSRVRIGYADQNGHPYQSIGRWLVQQGELTLDRASMEGIREWARKHPERLKEMLHSNPSYVFFRELPASSEGPVGAQGVPLTASRSIAVDPRHTPLGAPVFLATTYPNTERALNRLVIAQDTGGAIKGVVRADFFWGFGPEAGNLAGRMRQDGRMWVLLPKGAKPPATTPL